MSNGDRDLDLKARAAALYRGALVWDNHGCLPFEGTERWLEEIDLYRRAGVNVAMLNAGDGEESLETLIRVAARIRSFVRAHPEQYVMATTIEDILQAQREGKLAVGLDVEGVFALGEDLSLIELYYELGVRWMAMVYNRANLAGSGCHDAQDRGLTDFGRRVVREMDRVGLVKCCSHTGYRTAMDVLTGTDRPTLFSHSNPSAVHDHPRNIPDSLIDACAATGGVVCINGVGIFLGKNETTAGRFVEHVDHVAQRVGVAHVGIGLDYVFDQDGLAALLEKRSALMLPGGAYAGPIGFLSPELLPEVAEELLRRKYSEDAVRAVLGGNLLRVAREVWR
jgi:membrane dipeptidase